MRKWIVVAFAVLWGVLAGTLTCAGGELAPSIQAALRSLAPHEEVRLIISLSDRVDHRLFKEGNKRPRRLRLVRALKEKAGLTQGPLIARLKEIGAKRVVSLWIMNGVAVSVPSWAVPELADFPGVESVGLDRLIQAPSVERSTVVTPEWNLNAIKGPELWALGYTGGGAVVANIDTGVDLNHPDLANRWRGGNGGWFNPYSDPDNSGSCGRPNLCSPCELSKDTPCDTSGHGTGTMAIMVGGSAGGTDVGVAPDARWIAVKIFNDADPPSTTSSIIHQAFQWLLDPDGNGATQDAPDVVNASWGLSSVNECDLEHQPDIQALRAAGIAVVFAAGNSGPAGSSSVSPANYPEVFAAGAVDSSLNIAYFSSRGPSACDGSIFPEIVAPGVNVRTAALTFGGAFPNPYVNVTGTSFAAPHVAGAMALLLSAFPDLTDSDLEWAIKQSAVDLGPPGPDNAYGYGLLDVAAAYQLLLDSVGHVSVSPHIRDFGAVREGSFSPPQVFTVTNLDSKGVSVQAVSLTGPNAADFIIQSDTCSGQSIAPLGNCAVQVVFSPSSGGAEGATLSFLFEGASEALSGSVLNGTGVEQYRLSTIKGGTGTGTLKSIVAGIDCGSDCSEFYSPGAIVKLKAIPDPGSIFAGWSGCGKVEEGRCTVKMVGDKNVTATFIASALTLTSPSGGEDWMAGSIQRITWNYTGRPGTYVRIELLNGSDVDRVIAKGTVRGSNGSGLYRWRIPKSIPPGTDYKIRITSTTNSSYSDTSDPFTIQIK